MRKKIIFLLLFVFSLIIVHDTVLDVMQADPDSFVTQNSGADADNKAYQPLPHLHSMFHFVALIESEYPLLEAPKAQMSIAFILPESLYFDIEEDDRPPIV